MVDFTINDTRLPGALIKLTYNWECTPTDNGRSLNIYPRTVFVYRM